MIKSLVACIFNSQLTKTRIWRLNGRQYFNEQPFYHILFVPRVCLGFNECDREGNDQNPNKLICISVCLLWELVGCQCCFADWTDVHLPDVKIVTILPVGLFFFFKFWITIFFVDAASSVYILCCYMFMCMVNVWTSFREFTPKNRTSSAIVVMAANGAIKSREQKKKI